MFVDDLQIQAKTLSFQSASFEGGQFTSVFGPQTAQNSPPWLKVSDSIFKNSTFSVFGPQTGLNFLSNIIFNDCTFNRFPVLPMQARIPFPDHMDANQQPATHVLASSDANNNQATLRRKKKKEKVTLLGEVYRRFIKKKKKEM